ncbi:hypothetical protein F9879_18225 [Morganella morganii]|uniref:hypothetical protein n=1 Tax=Morganella morganii TaxID=582 RepID=UPI000D9978C5|nr:hypothetical protein [Morganella morganii]HDS6456896.1 hypothetical protein [Morganella morganii subsp. morganii]MBA5838924.1 hypothetical protein [Morganella morganii]RAX26890.1 hypothetical protein DQ401_09130 [Morganella morganii]SPX72039.1 Uncharacterised protein [Morganella morganii]HCR4427365.1 hypothetical protein [Morganella morganii]
MADIYDAVVRHDMNLLSTEALKNIIRDSEEACNGLALAMKTVGQLAFHSLNSDDYTDQQARDHLSGLSDLMMYLPRIVNGIQQNLLTAQYEISRRGVQS